MKFTKLLVAAGIALSALGAQAQVFNGSFEEDAQADKTWSTYNSLAGGWIGMTNIELRNNVFGKAQDGVNFVELDTKTNMSMKQTLTSLATSEYLLSFWYSARPGTTAITNGLEYTLGDLKGEVFPTAIVGTSSPNVWQHFTGKVFLAGNTDLVFKAIGTSDSLGTSLDNVSVTAVPEAETYAMMLAGLGLMGSIVRRRKAKNA